MEPTKDIYLVTGKEYGTSFAVEWIQWQQVIQVGQFYPIVVVFGVPRSGFRFFDCLSSCDQTWLDAFFLPEPAPHWLESMFDK